MKIYLDTGNIDEIKTGIESSILDGITTNPSLIAKEGGTMEQNIKNICKLIPKNNDEFTVSAEVTGTTAQEMIKEGEKLAKIDKHVVVKIPIGVEGIKAVSALAKKNIRTNVTLCFSTNQALLAAKAGAFIISPFMGRLDDIDTDPLLIIEEIRELYDTHGFQTQILAASTRTVRQVTDCALIGADICTMPYKIFDKLFKHPLTDLGLEKFQKDWQKNLAASKKKNTKK